MTGSAWLAVRVTALAGLLLTIGATGLPAQQRVGVNSAVNLNATGTPPGAPSRRLVIGQDVVFNEHITTTETGQTQLLFLDQSAMTIGPNSDLTIDQFVYDPKTGAGKLAMSATRGLLRYVGGKLSKQDEAVTLRTGTATLAVRGGAFIVNITANGGTEAIFIYGKGLTVTGAAGGSQTVIRPGYQTITNRGGGPSPPALGPPGHLAQLLARLDGRTGGTGGAPVIPTDTTVVNSGVPETISGNVTESVQQSAQNQGTTSPILQLLTFNSAINPNQVPVQTQAPPVLLADGAGQVINCVSAGTCDPFSATQVGTTASGQAIGGPSSILPTTSAADLRSLASMQSQATYTGLATGSVFNAGRSYTAAGSFIGTYNFGTQTGTTAINFFDGRFFTASGTAPLSGASYSLGVTTPGYKGTMSGTFYGRMAAETAGNFAIRSTVGPTYLASGIFAGKQ